MGHIIGIDLGTTNSLAAYWKDGESILIPNALGNYLTPSVVSVDEDGTVYVGDVAKERLISHPDRTVSVFKRSMGTDRTWQLGGKWYRPEELSALVLRKLREDAEHFLGEPVEEAVISVPAYFGETARRATRDAGRLAGLKVDRIVNEPSAAALACQHMKKQQEAHLLVYDLGGGTLDVSLVHCFENIVEITAVSGDTHLGGSDFDRLIAERFCSQNGMQPFGMQPKGLQEALLRSAEAAKKHLSQFQTAIMAVQMPDCSGVMELTQKELISLSGSLLRRMAEPVNTVMRDGHMTAADIDRIVLVGGSTKMPLVQQYLRYILRDVPIVTANPDYMVALGAGVYAGIKERDASVKDMIMTDICPFSLGVNVVNESDRANSYMSVIIPRNSALPISRTHIYSNASDMQTCSLFGVYQGEDLYAKNNKKLGELSVHYPEAKKGERSVGVRFTYDINGLLIVHARVLPDGEEKEVVFLNGRQTDAADATVHQRVEELKKLRLGGRDQEEVDLLLARAERVYTQITGGQREQLQAAISRFSEQLASGRSVETQKAEDALTALLDRIEREIHTEIGEEKETLSGFMDWMEGTGTTEDGLTDEWTVIQ